MSDTIVINVITPTPAPVDIDVDDFSTQIDVAVSSIGETGPQGEPGPSEGSLNFVIDGGSSVITTGIKGFVEWGFNATVTGWTILADVVGDIVVDVWKDSYGNFAPTIADTIAGSERPTLVAAQKNQDLSLTSFQTTVLEGDIWAFNIDSISSIKKVTIAFRFNKT